MTLSPETEAEIRRLFFAEHWKVGTIEAQLGVHHDGVLRVTGLNSPRRVLPARDREPGVAPFVDFIAETLERYPRLRSTRLYDMLKGRGYMGSVRSLRRYVARVRPVARRGAFLRLEPFVGEQAQVDWAFIGQREVPGGRRGLWLFVMVLSWSRMLFAECVWDLTAVSLRRSLIRAHCFYGGSPRQWLFDNPRTIVLGRQGDAVRFHPTVVEMSSTFCVQARLCNVRAPQEKGRVERAVRYLRDRFLAGREIRDVVEGNRELVAFLRDVAPARPHPRLPDRTVGDAFVEERSKLLALPDAMPSCEQTVPVSIDGTAFARFDGNLYSAPSMWAGRSLTLAADDARVRLLDGTDELVPIGGIDDLLDDVRHVLGAGEVEEDLLVGDGDPDRHRAEVQDTSLPRRDLRLDERHDVGVLQHDPLRRRLLAPQCHIGFDVALARRQDGRNHPALRLQDVFQGRPVGHQYLSDERAGLWLRECYSLGRWPVLDVQRAIGVDLERRRLVHGIAGCPLGNSPLASPAPIAGAARTAAIGAAPFTVT